MDSADYLGQPVTIARMRAADAADWLVLRNALWPHGADGIHAQEIEMLLADAGETLNLMARDENGCALGFAEAALRHDYVNGCETSPVAFLEGIYVVPEARMQGVARMLVGAVQDWGRSCGCTEFASDALADNAASHAMHRALGFDETRTVVFFRKRIG